MKISESGNRPDRIVLRGTLVSDGARVQDGLLATEGELIVYAGTASGFDAATFGAADTPALPTERLILPGLVDVHTHGGYGGSFPDADEVTARRAIDFLHRSGTTSALASLVTASVEDLLAGVRLLSRLTEEGLLAGIHLEGPFLSADRCGAQNPQWLRNPDPDLLAQLAAAGRGTVATMTYAPELPGADRLVDLLCGLGITPSLGHTDCDDATAAASLARGQKALAFGGARPTVTHLFNGMPPMLSRSPGPVAACLRAARASAAVVELVADDTHLDPATVRTVFELAGAANIALVTDSMAAAGLQDGAYQLGSLPVTVTAGVARLDGTGSIAGGTATLLTVLRRVVAAGVALESAVLSATAVPAAVAGLVGTVGSLRAGYRADAVVTTGQLEPVAVLRRGAWLEPWT